MVNFPFSLVSKHLRSTALRLKVKNYAVGTANVFFTWPSWAKPVNDEVKILPFFMVLSSTVTITYHLPKKMYQNLMEKPILIVNLEMKIGRNIWLSFVPYSQFLALYFSFLDCSFSPHLLGISQKLLSFPRVTWLERESGHLLFSKRDPVFM